MFVKKLVLLLFLVVFSFTVSAQDLAPEFAGAKGWLNTEKPLTLRELKGKVVLLDFWTYGCINCIHIIPDLKKLEAKYQNELVVIGVHSGKFSNERETENIRRIILRYELEHPVANDSDFKIWDAYSVQAYPTQVLINPSGEEVLKTVGEGQLGTLDEKTAEVIEEARNDQTLSDKQFKFQLEKDKFADSPLLFPGKVLADAKSNRLFIADSNHNRIVVTKLDGTLIETIGSGKAALTDGDFQTASFNRLQGMALDNDFLFVADTENHAIRKIDLIKKTVEIVAGTGAQSWARETGAGTKTGLNSPWDLQIVGRDLYVAMAGNHQIWRMNLETNEIGHFAGSGREERADGSFSEAGFSQPSALAFDGKNLFVADSEANIIRKIDLQRRKVTTVAGGDLYDFGDTDGAGDSVRLQHPLGLAIAGKQIFIADTYNHKIKTLNPALRTIKTFLGDGKSGDANGAKAKFYEPGGISAAGGKLFIADTNNHQIRSVDLRTKQTATLKINGLQTATARK